MKHFQSEQIMHKHLKIFNYRMFDSRLSIQLKMALSGVQLKIISYP